MGSLGSERGRVSGERGVVAVLCLILLACVLVVTLSMSSEIGLSLRTTANGLRIAQAERVAAAGAEQALHQAATLSGWRSFVADAGPDTPLVSDVDFAGGRFTVYVYDPDNQALILDPMRPLVIRSIGVYQDTTRTLCLRAVAPIHEAVTYAVCSTMNNWDLDLSEGITLHGAVRANEDVRVTDSSGVHVVGDLYSPSAAFVTPSLLDADTQHITADRSISMPEPDFQWFIGRASRVNATTLTNAVLTPLVNLYGLINLDGLYYIDGGGGPVEIENLYLQGTLVINNTNGVTFKKGLIHKAVRLDYPAILCDAPWGGLVFELDNSLSELTMILDLNGDGDLLDALPSEINGIVYNSSLLNGFVKPGSAAGVTVRGSVIARTLSLHGANVTIDQNLDLITHPVVGFQGIGLVRVAGSLVMY